VLLSLTSLSHSLESELLERQLAVLWNLFRKLNSVFDEIPELAVPSTDFQIPVSASTGQGTRSGVVTQNRATHVV
jgi:hypothetical protein